MINQYFRPSNLEEALRLLEKDPYSTFPLGGGNSLSQSEGETITVVDLQLLNLDRIAKKGSVISIGACSNLQNLIENDVIPQAIKDAAIREGPINKRRTGTIAGALVTQKGRSPLGIVLAVLGARIITVAENEGVDFLAWTERLEDGKPTPLVTKIEIEDPEKTVYLDISKTPADIPMVYSAFSEQAAGDFRWVIGINEKSAANIFLTKGKTVEELKKNAHSHYAQSIPAFYSHLMDILLERSFSILSSNGRGK